VHCLPNQLRVARRRTPPPHTTPVRTGRSDFVQTAVELVEWTVDDAWGSRCSANGRGASTINHCSNHNPSARAVTVVSTVGRWTSDVQE
jgi:hypothetical protein